MKGSPIVATAITIIVLLGLYLGMRAILLPETPVATTAAHADHDHSSHQANGGHNDSALETDFELYFSSTPKSVKVTQPSTQKEVLTLTEFDSPEWTGTGTISLDGHHVELQLDIVWQTPGELNFVELVASPAKHATKKATLRSDGDISDIIELRW